VERVRRWRAGRLARVRRQFPDVVAEMETALALAIARGADLYEANPDALALLLRAAAPPTSARVRSRSCCPIRDTKNEWPYSAFARSRCTQVAASP
jgi:hypothetical protein